MLFRFFDVRDLFFLMICRPPLSTLFPSRRSSDLDLRRAMENERRRNQACPPEMHPGPQREQSPMVTRSEEHTSELQSQSNLVCRLLLEKKNCVSGSTLRLRIRKYIEGK